MQALPAGLRAEEFQRRLGCHERCPHLPGSPVDHVALLRMPIVDLWADRMRCSLRASRGLRLMRASVQISPYSTRAQSRLGSQTIKPSFLLPPPRPAGPEHTALLGTLLSHLYNGPMAHTFLLPLPNVNIHTLQTRGAGTCQGSY